LIVFWDAKSKSAAAIEILFRPLIAHKCTRSFRLRLLRRAGAKSSLRMTECFMPLTFHKKPALIVYVTCGDPDLATTREIVLAAIAAGADVIELGVPFSDPVADGPVIQRGE